MGLSTHKTSNRKSIFSVEAFFLVGCRGLLRMPFFSAKKNSVLLWWGNT